MSIRGQLKLALVLFYVIAFFVDVPLEARVSALLLLTGIFGYLVATRRSED